MRTGPNSVGDLLFGSNRGHILAALYARPDESLFVRQIAREVGGSSGTVQRELKTLTDAGLIVRSESGSQVFYRANREHPVYPELRALLQKTVGVIPMLAGALQPLRDRIAFALVYGSFARGTENARSDIDLMVIGPVTLDEVLEHVGPLEHALKRTISPSIYSLRELKTKLKAKNHFLRTVQQGECIFLMGTEDEFRAIR